jgi:hypothetical protein
MRDTELVEGKWYYCDALIIEGRCFQFVEHVNHYFVVQLKNKDYYYGTYSPSLYYRELTPEEKLGLL